ncbi:MAG: cytochrome P450 [Nocardioides sp.]
MRVVGYLKKRLAKRLLARTVARGIDLRQLRFLPDTITMPLQRDGLDPLPELAAIRETAPVTRLTEMFGVGIWLVSGYDEARAVLADATSFSNDLGRFVSQEGRDPSEQIGGLGMTDPPHHTTLRRYLTPEFTKKRLARLEPRIQAIVDGRLDAMEAAADGGGALDLVAEFAFPVPFEVICELLGLPVDDRLRFRDLGVARFDLSDGGAGVFGAAAHSRDFLIGSVAKQRRDPGDGLIGALLTEHGDDLDDVTLGGLADGVFLGGYETSASMLALGTYLVATHPDAMARLRADDETVDGVIEELLRHLSVVQLAFLRFARHDVEIGGATISAGDCVGVSLLGANRDPRVTPDADGFDPARAPTRHLAFGYGLHRCVGVELARMELRIALCSLAHRFPDLRVAADRSELGFRKLSAVYGVERLPVRLLAGDPAPTGGG